MTVDFEELVKVIAKESGYDIEDVGYILQTTFQYLGDIAEEE